MLMGCFGSFGASVSLKMPSFDNGCFYVHNIFLSFWKLRPMVWGSSVPPALCVQVSSAAQTVLVIQSGEKVVVYKATCPYPSTRSRSGMANVLLSHLFLNKGFSCTWDTMDNPAQSRRTPGIMCQWLEQKKRRSKRWIYLKMFLGLWVVRILLSLLTAMGFSITTSNGVLAWDLPPITSNCSDMVCFQPVSSTPRLCAHLQFLTIFTWMPWNARLLD